MKFAGINYHCHLEWRDPEPVLELHARSTGYLPLLAASWNITQIKHLLYHGELHRDGIHYLFRRSANRFWQVPEDSHKVLKELQPDIVLIEGFVFPVQVIALRKALGNRPVLIAQHHGERPFGFPKRILQQRADACIDAYLFHSIGNAKEWMEAKVISDKQKCFELPSASTNFKSVDRDRAKQFTGMEGRRNILWVGRLVKVKDPLTVIKGFSIYHAKHPDAKLHLIYQDDTLMNDIKLLKSNLQIPEGAILFHGMKSKEELPNWYSAADVYVSGSTREGSGYALAEAMACGCMPVVTKIPSFLEMSDGGRLAQIYEPGDHQALAAALEKAIETTVNPGILMARAREKYSFNAITEKIKTLGAQLIEQKSVHVSSRILHIKRHEAF